MDRSLNRILSLPLFDDEFVRALKLVRLDHVEFWLAVVDDRSIAVDSKLAGLVSASHRGSESKRSSAESTGSVDHAGSPDREI